MIANNEKLNHMVEVTANAAAISEEFLRSLFPKDRIAMPEEMIFAAAMKNTGMHNAVVEEVFDEYRRLGEFIMPKLGLKNMIATGGGQGEINVAVYLDGKKMTDIVAKTIISRARAKGFSQH